MYGGVEQIRCEFELTDDGLSGKSVHSEMSFPWSRLTRVADLQGSIELWFDPGLVVIRDRAFQTQEERRNFLDAGYVTLSTAMPSLGASSSLVGIR